MITLSQRLLHTSLPHRMVGVRNVTTRTPEQIAAMARDLIRNPTDESIPVPTYQTGQSLPPYELSGQSEQQKSAPRRPPLLGPPNKIAKQIDPFYISGSDPLDHVLNPAMARSFVNQMGRIKSRAETGLTWKNQRKVGKLVRRARAMGLISRWTDRDTESLSDPR